MFVKKDKSASVKEVVERNTGMNIDEFINTNNEPHIHNLKETAEFIKNYVSTHPNPDVRIIGDYDADGDTSSSILFWMFKALGIKATVRIPRRFSEGYGLSVKIVNEIPDGDRLIVTCDNGIASYEAIKLAKQKGFTVVITDHHLPPRDKDGNMVLPPADIILNPHVYPELSEFEDYCGAGIAYRLAKELLPNMNLVQLLVLASIGTVADVMPLVGANRNMVISGLKAVNERKCLPGLNAIIASLNMDDHITEDDYGFMLGPVFNASGRLYDNGAERVVNVLTSSKTDPELGDKAQNLVQINNIRKSLVRESMERVNKNITGERPIVICDEEIGEGIIGIIAGQLTEDYNCPSIVFTKTENEKILKGSGRSIPGIHLKEVLDKIQDKIVGYGGHAGAAGLSIERDKLDEFTKAFKEACGEIPGKSEDIEYDLELNGNYSDIMKEMLLYGPYGEGNPKILYHSVFDVTNSEYKIIGDGTHFMIKNKDVTLMGFGLKDKYEKAGSPKKIDCVGYLSENWFNNKISYRFEILDFKS